MTLNRSRAEAFKDVDQRNLLIEVLQQLETIGQATGVSTLAPVNSKQAPASAPPPAASLSVSGANGAFSVAVSNPSQSVSKTIYHEISYSPKSNFSSGVTTLPVSTATQQAVQLPGTTANWRIRSSYDQKNWNSYAVHPVVSSGLQSSAATENANVLNQTNYANVDSVAVGVTANVRIYGKAGPTTQYPSVKGGSETIRPSATIIGVQPSSTQVVGFDGENYQVRGTLPEVLADGITPTGSVSVVGIGAPTLPTIAPVFGSGGSIIAYDVTSGGSGATGPYTLTYGSVGGGSGASFGAQTIVGGVLISVAAGNPGSGYSGGTTVTASGGVFSGATGGGRGIGGNGGRLIVNDGTTN